MPTGQGDRSTGQRETLTVYRLPRILTDSQDTATAARLLLTLNLLYQCSRTDKRKHQRWWTAKVRKQVRKHTEQGRRTRLTQALERRMKRTTKAGVYPLILSLIKAIFFVGATRHVPVNSRVVR
jgi:predicted deacetylase